MTAINAEELPDEVLERMGFSTGVNKVSLTPKARLSVLGKILQLVGDMKDDDARWVLIEALSYLRREYDNSDPRSVIQVVARFFGITPAEVLGRRRSELAVNARQIVMYLLWGTSQYSLSQVGEVLGGRSPATVSHGFQTIARRIKSDPTTAEWVKRIKLELNWETL